MQSTHMPQNVSCVRYYYVCLILPEDKLFASSKDNLQYGVVEKKMLIIQLSLEFCVSLCF